MSRNANGTFGKGNKFSKGRIKGSLNRATILKQQAQDSDRRTSATQERGRRWAAQAVFDMQRGESLPALDIAALQTIDDIIGAQSEIVSRVASRHISPYDGKRLMDRLDRHRAGLTGPRPDGAGAGSHDNANQTGF
jgi:hypothetical protein